MLCRRWRGLTALDRRGMSGPVRIEPAQHFLNVVVRLQVGHKIYFVQDSLVCELVWGSGLRPPAGIHGVDKRRLVVAQVQQGGDVEGDHHLMLCRVISVKSVLERGPGSGEEAVTHVFVDQVMAMEQIHATPRGIMRLDLDRLARPKPDDILQTLRLVGKDWPFAIHA
jgi:hypothetical protein